MNNKKELTVIGWREWISLPELNIPIIKAKIDTGARTSCLHAFKIKLLTRKGNKIIEFSIHPHQHDSETVITSTAEVLDIRWVMDSGGHRTKRYVIKTTMVMGDFVQDIEITLMNRDSMRFRMLLGRTALKNHFIVDPALSFTQKNRKDL